MVKEFAETVVPTTKKSYAVIDSATFPNKCLSILRHVIGQSLPDDVWTPQ